MAFRHNGMVPIDDDWRSLAILAQNLLFFAMQTQMMFEGDERTNCEVLKVGPAEIKFLYSPFGNCSLRLRISLFKRGPTQLLQPFDLKLAHQVLNLDFGYKKARPPPPKWVVHCPQSK